jgi:hypothetical protein
VAARKEDALWREVADEGVAHVMRMNFAIDMRLAHAAGDQLRNLGTEIENEDFLVGHMKPEMNVGLPVPGKFRQRGLALPFLFC